ncbi:MAG: hypothetical protein K2I52_01380 [Muribaculaceae bacterium]|nr:hypothetical protein [Muribaculaceae bacterium]
MRKCCFFVVFVAFVLTIVSSLCSCGESKLEREQRVMIDSLQNVNVQTRMDYDNLSEYLTTISVGLDSIYVEEQEIMINIRGAENGRMNRQRMKQQLDHVRLTLGRHRDRIAELEQKLASTQGAEKKLHTIIVALKQQIEQKDAELSRLRADLDNSRRSITELQATVAQMHEVQDSQQQTIAEQQNALVETQKKLTTAYVKIATKDELKKLGLLKGGGLFKKTKIDYSEFNKSVFDCIDITSTTSFRLPKKYKILTSVPESSYTIQSEGDVRILTITDRDLFWSVSNYLVIQIN